MIPFFGNDDGQIYRALVQIVNAGGFYAILGILIWCLAPIIKVSVIGGVVWAIFRCLSTQISNILLLRNHSKQQTITLLGKQTSRHLEEAITSWRTETERVSKDLMKSVSELRESRKDSSPKYNVNAKAEPVSTNS